MGASELILKAAVYAADAHSSQRRKGLDEPYVNHPLRVACLASACGLSEMAIVAALLHDVVEDTPRRFEDLENEFPARAVALVRLLTKWWPDDAEMDIKRQENPKYYGAIAGDPEAVAIKLLDRTDNLRDMHRMLPRARGWARRYLNRSADECSPLIEFTANDAVARHYRSALDALSQALEDSEAPPSEGGARGPIDPS